MAKPVRHCKEAIEAPVGLVERTTADIQNLIRERRLVTGDSLPAEATLAAELGVSRAVAREAMRGLAALRILEVGNSRRARVAAPDAEALSMILDHTIHTRQLSIQQILDVRRTLELRTSALAAMRRTGPQAEALHSIVGRMLDALESEQETIMELDISFHEIIARASGNPLYSILVDSFRVITRQTWPIGWRARATSENRLENVRCHERIALAIGDQDAQRAETAMTEHFDSAVSTLLRAGVN